MFTRRSLFTSLAATTLLFSGEVKGAVVGNNNTFPQDGTDLFHQTFVVKVGAYRKCNVIGMCCSTPLYKMTSLAKQLKEEGFTAKDIEIARFEKIESVSKWHGKVVSVFDVTEIFKSCFELFASQ